MIIIGIDPGVYGAVAVMKSGAFEEGFRVIRAVRLPTTNNLKGKKVLDAVGTARFLQLMAGDETQPIVFFENVQPIPGKIGASGAFQYGKTVGVLMGMVYAFGWPMHLITPSQWKRQAGLLKQDKEASRKLAQEMYPTVNLRLKKDTDLAEAILIAHFGWEIVQA